MNNASTIDRDFIGYGATPPAMRWPGDAGLAVSVVLNIEEGAELSVRDGDERNEAVHEVVHEIQGAPDLCMASHFEYGTRVGYRRIVGVAANAGIPLTLNACGRSLIGLPWLARDAIMRGHEICAHGWRWESHAGMDEAREREVIARTYREIARVAGVAPVGWHTKSSASVRTRELLVQHGGFLYDSDAYNDDLPYYLAVEGRAHLVLPYSFDTNDMRFFGQAAFVKAGDFADYLIDSFDWLRRESLHQPRMMTIGLHLRIMGRAGRIAGLETALAHMRQAGGAWFARRDAIARHWRAVVPP
jgi:allantoinase